MGASKMLLSLGLAALQATAGAGAAVASGPPDPPTVAEASGYTATTRHGEAVAFLRTLDERSDALRLTSMGTTVEGREIPLAVIADPMVRDAAEARASGRMVAFLFGAIHGGEVDGKEALLELAREWALAPGASGSRAILDHFVVLVAPVYNADGNERIGADTRPGQDGPSQGQGVRASAMGLDLNRDYVKLEAPETRALVRLLNEWDPDITIDTHTTNGSFHRYALTFEAPTNPGAPDATIALSRDVILPEVAGRLEARTGIRTFFYGDFDDDTQKKEWRTYSALPRFGGPYMGLRGSVSILAESYSYAPYRERIEASREFVRECLLVGAERGEALRRLRARVLAMDAMDDATLRMLPPVGVRHDFARPGERVRIAGWVEEPDPARPGRLRPTETPAEHEVEHLGQYTATLRVARGRGFYIAPGHEPVLETLRAHGAEVRIVEAPRDAVVEVQRVARAKVAEREFQGHRLLLLDTSTSRESWTVGAGWAYVPVNNRLGSLVSYLLEPQAEDGLFAWGFFGTDWEEGAELPVLRVPVDVGD